MPVLPDRYIQTMATEGMVKPYDHQLVNPASIDLRLGNVLLIESAVSPELIPYPLSRHTRDQPYLLQPHQFALADTLETISLPETVSGQIALKSSVARLGLEHLMAGWIDPGFSGTVTLELCNVRQLHAIPLGAGMRVAQLVLLRMVCAPSISYTKTGRYMNQSQPTPSLGIPH